MVELASTDRVFPKACTKVEAGRVVTSWSKTIWLLSHGLLGLAGLFFFTTPSALLVFLAVTGLTICAGHSVGMHRLLIHRSFATYRSIEYVLVWLGTLVGMAGPFGMIRAHDMRDWHQQQTICPPHPSHNAPFWKDAWWQLCCEYKLDHPPDLIVEDRVAQDRNYMAMERYWMLQQVPLALVFFVIGGLGWVLWGISLRIFVSLAGHWMIGHFAHRRGQQGWAIEGLPVQGYNLPGFGLLTFGENWHGNHHAFPHSAKLGVDAGQFDPGFLMISTMECAGLAWDVKLPQSKPARDGLRRL